MKAIFILISLMSVNAFATVEGMTSGWIVVQNIQDDTDFTVMSAPIVGCYGLAQGPQLDQFTAPYMVKSSMGCGFDDGTMTDINALSCGVVTDSEENADFISFKKIVLDISKCAAKNNAKFITMIRTAAARNFPQTKKGKIIKGKEVNLVIVK